MGQDDADVSGAEHPAGEDEPVRGTELHRALHHGRTVTGGGVRFLPTAAARDTGDEHEHGAQTC